jgi:hypothetical protein
LTAGTVAASCLYAGDTPAGRRERVRFVFQFRHGAHFRGPIGRGPVGALDGSCVGKKAERPDGVPGADAYITPPKRLTRWGGRFSIRLSEPGRPNPPFGFFWSTWHG